MAEEKSIYDKCVKVDAFWKPYRYYALGAYVSMYNMISNNPLKYGLGEQNYDIQINKYIKDHFDELNSDLGLKFKSYESVTGVPYSEAKKYKIYDLPYIKEDFFKDFDWLVGEAREVSETIHASSEKGKNSMMTSHELVNLLKAKEDDTKSYYEKLRINEKYKTLNFDKDLKAKSGKHAVELQNALSSKEEKEHHIKRTRRRAFWTGAATLLFGAVTVASGFGILSFGGAALGTLFGTASSAASVGAGVASVAGAVAGSGLVKKFYDKFIKHREEVKVFKEDYKDFIQGHGKYVDKDGRPMSFNKIKEQFKICSALKAYMDAAGRHWKELLGYGPGGKPKMTYEQLLNKIDKKHVKFLIDPKYRARHHSLFRFRDDDEAETLHMGFSLKKLAEEGIHTAFVNEFAGKNEGFSNIYQTRSKVVNEYKEYVKSIPEVVSMYNNFLESTDPEIVKQRNDVEGILGRLEDFKKYEEDFKKLKGSGSSQYNDIIDKFSFQVENTLKNSLLNGSFSKDVLEQVGKALDNEDVKKALNDGPKKIKIDYLKSIYKFIVTENKAGKEIIDIGVSVENQLNIDASHILAGCKNMPEGVSDTDPSYADIVEISNKIGGLATKRDSDEIKEKIESVECSDGVKKYLNFMLNKKTSSTKRDESDLESKIREFAGLGDTDPLTGLAVTIAKIANMKDGSDSIKIRNEIAGRTDIDENIKDAIYKVVNEQMNSVEDKKRRDSKKNVFNRLQKGGTSGVSKTTELESWITKISEIKADVSSEVIDKDYHYQISGIENINVRQYLLDRLKDQLQKVFINYIKDDTSFVVTDNNFTATMAEVRKFMKKLGVFAPKYIDEWQKQECLDAFGVKMKNIFEGYLKEVEEGYLKDSGAKSSAAKVLLKDEMDKGGFSEYFKSNTPDSIKIAERLNRIFEARNYYQLMYGVGTIGYVHDIIDDGADYNRKMLKIFFSENRNSSDPLVKMFKKLKEYTGSNMLPNIMQLKTDPERLSAIPPFVEGSGFDLTQNTINQTIFDGDTPGTVTNVDYKKSFVYNMIVLLGSDDFRSLKAKDQLATIYVMRKYVAAMLRSQLGQFKMKFKSEVNSHDFIKKHEEQILMYLGENWKHLAECMDAARDEAASKLSEEEEEYADNSNFEGVIRKICNPTDFENQIENDKVMGM